MDLDTRDRLAGDYGEWEADGSIISMVVDSKERTISWTMDGKDFGVGYKEIDIDTYRMGIEITNAGDKFELIGYSMKHKRY